MDQWRQKEEENARQQRSAELQAQLEEEKNPKRRLLHRFFNLISFVAGASAFLMGVGQLVGMVFGHVGIVHYVLRVYVIFLCLLCILVELEWTKIVKDSSILSYWITRGCFYAFIGVLGIVENETMSLRDSDKEHWAHSLVYIKVVAWMMVGVGILYFTMGILCLQIAYNRLRKNYQERLAHAEQVRQTTERYMSPV